MISLILKEETKLLHIETEKSLNAKRIFSTDFSVEEYGALLNILYIAHLALEDRMEKIKDPELWVFCSNYYSPHRDFIKKDLDHHQSFKADLIMLPPLDISDLNAIGILYVLKGLSIGSKFIYKHLQATRANIFSTQFYNISSNQTTEDWKAFCDALESLKFLPVETDQVIKGAKIAFETFIQASLVVKKA